MGVKRGFYINGLRVSDLNLRLKSHQNKENWLSLRPNDYKYCNLIGGFKVGELNENNHLHGRGIRIESHGYYLIRYFKNGYTAVGSYIEINSDGGFEVGEYYRGGPVGGFKRRGTFYHTNGSKNTF